MRPDEPCRHEWDETGPLARFFYVTGLPCTQCEREARDAWIEDVRAKLTAGLEASARGEGYDWNPAPGDGERFALMRLNDRIDLALTVDENGRCTVPVAGLYGFGRTATLQEAIDAERDEQVLRKVRHGVMTISQAKRAIGGNARWLDD